MRQALTVLILFGFFVLEGTLAEWVIPTDWQSQVYVVPHLVLIGILYISLFKNRYQGLAYGLGFGFLQDLIYYGHSIGVYSFTLGLVGYSAGLAFRRAQVGIVTSMLIVIFGNLLYETLIYGIYRLFLSVIRVDMEWSFLHLTLPSTLFNLLLALLLYLPARKWLEKSDSNREDDDK